jgi:ATP-dependent DNA ligase
LPLAERRTRLEQLLTTAPPRVRLSSTLDEKQEILVPITRDQGLEGIVAKDTRSLYESGKRSAKWQKFKLCVEEEFVIGGFVPGSNGTVEALVLGVSEDGPALRRVSARASAATSQP